MVVKPIDALKKKIAELEEEKVLLEQSNQNRIAEIVKLQKELEKFKSLETNLKKEKQKSKEQEKTIIKLEQELVDVRAELDKTQNEDMKTFRDKLAKAHNEVGYLNKHIRSQDKNMIQLRQEVKSLREGASSSDTELSKQMYETELLRIELENLQKTIPENNKMQKKYADPSFKEYVKTKRDLSQLKAENRKLRSTISKQSPREGNLSYLIEDENTEEE